MNARRILADVGLILLCVVATLALEQVVVGFVARRFFVAAWEYAVIRKLVSPLALALFVPASLGLACIMQLLHSARIRATLPAVQAGAAGVLMLALTTSHRFERVLVRAAVVLLFAAAVGLAARVVLPRLERAPVRVQRGLAAAGIALAWTADAFVLVRLYPPFHLAWFLILLACTAWLAATLRAPSMDRVGYVASAAALMSCAWAWRSRGRVFVYDNVVLVLSERAPLHGRAVAIAALLAPPGDIVTPDVGTPATPIPARRQRNIDWAGHDILLVSIDALRADHVSAYGYARKTTPHIDALAAQGVRFDHAYCPTPHTSYSVTSMMTGKYMRPLLLMGMGQDSETWPQVLRRYDYKTAAFYPPAVFFIDEDKFRAFSESALGFEYKKEEFADPDLRVQQMESYLATAPPQTPLFAWVHLFEPHEPYEAHAGFHFEGSTDLDAYDGEVAFADAAVGRIVDVMKKRARPLVVIVTADHGEEFGEHGGATTAPRSTKSRCGCRW